MCSRAFWLNVLNSTDSHTKYKFLLSAHDSQLSDQYKYQNTAPKYTKQFLAYEPVERIVETLERAVPCGACAHVFTCPYPQSASHHYTMTMTLSTKTHKILISMGFHYFRRCLSVNKAAFRQRMFYHKGWWMYNQINYARNEFGELVSVCVPAYVWGDPSTRKTIIKTCKYRLNCFIYWIQLIITKQMNK